MFNKLSPVLIVDAIEPCLDFWKRVGFEVTVALPETGPLAFAILSGDGLEVMYQTRASIKEDVPALADMRTSVALYLEVEDLDAIARRLEGAPVVIPRRKTFYGATEIGVREPGGNVVTFAEVG